MLSQKFAETCKKIQSIEFSEFNKLSESKKKDYMDFYLTLKRNLLNLFYDIILSHMGEYYKGENYSIYRKIYDAIQQSPYNIFTTMVEEKCKVIDNLSNDAKLLIYIICEIFLNDKFDFKKLDTIEQKDKKIVLWALFSKEYPNICFSSDGQLISFVNKFLYENKLGVILTNIRNSPSRFSTALFSNIESSTIFIKELYKKIDKNIEEENKKIIEKEEIIITEPDLPKEVKKPKVIKVKDEETPKKYKKEKIPAALRNVVWNQNFQDVSIGKCLCCKTEPITRANFHCGHIVSEKKGGELTVQNLRPICPSCNSSMGTQNMDEFMKKYGFDKL